MRIQLQRLVLECRRSREIIDFVPNINFFYGEIGTGKSSIVRFIDFCLGGNAERTPAIQREAISVQLSAFIGNYTVVLDRNLKNSAYVIVTWMEAPGSGIQVSAPIQAGDSAIWESEEGDKLYTLGDIIYYLMGVSPPKVRKNKQDPDAELIRLSFRDMMWYCYLQQEDMESSFFNLNTPILMSKSRDVSRFVMGYYSEKLNQMQINLMSIMKDRKKKMDAAEQIRKVLSDRGMDTIEDIVKERTSIMSELSALQDSKRITRADYGVRTHFVDELRDNLRRLSDRLDEEEQALTDLAERIGEQERLSAELLTSKFKLARVGAATTLLTGVKFERCPQCATSLSDRRVPDNGTCYLCLQVPTTDESVSTQSEAIRSDLNNRIEEIQDSLKRYRTAQQQQSRLVESIARQKAEMDAQLTEELAEYDSAYLAEFRENERSIAQLNERFAGLEKLAVFPEVALQLEEEAQNLLPKIDKLRQDIQAERDFLVDQEKYIQEIEAVYLEILLVVQFPGISSNDKVVLNRSTWQPEIHPADGDTKHVWGYANAGSSGKKTLLKVCYCLALHKVAAQYNLPLPSLIMIDTPMKNLDPFVNEENYKSFYKYLLNLAESSLSDTQFILVDSQYPELSSEYLQIKSRKMTLSDPNFPPLIPYYNGP